MYTLDSNAIIYFVQDEPKAKEKLDLVFSSDSTLFISAISIAEIFSAGELPASEKEAIEGVLSVLSPVPLDETLARQSGLLRSKYKLKLADSIIAATSIIMGSILVTRNIKDFRKIPNIKLLEI